MQHPKRPRAARRDEVNGSADSLVQVIGNKLLYDLSAGKKLQSTHTRFHGPAAGAGAKATLRGNWWHEEFSEAVRAGAGR